MLSAQEKVIICPHCGYEYLTGEIFVPNYLIGQPRNVQRDDNGKILGHSGIQCNWSESYVCDRCNKKFYVTITPRISTTKPRTTSEEFTQSLVENKNEKIYLKED